MPMSVHVPGLRRDFHDDGLVVAGRDPRYDARSMVGLFSAGLRLR
jgi:hypothetical protein